MGVGAGQGAIGPATGAEVHGRTLAETIERGEGIDEVAETSHERDEHGVTGIAPAHGIADDANEPGDELAAVEEARRHRAKKSRTAAVT